MTIMINIGTLFHFFLCCKIIARARNLYAVPSWAGAIGEGHARVSMKLAHQNPGNTAITFSLLRPLASHHIHSIIIKVDSHHLVHQRNHHWSCNHLSVYIIRCFTHLSIAPSRCLLPAWPHLPGPCPTTAELYRAQRSRVRRRSRRVCTKCVRR
jgi:hypothetical protein